MFYNEDLKTQIYFLLFIDASLTIKTEEIMKVLIDYEENAKKSNLPSLFDKIYGFSLSNSNLVGNELEVCL